MACRLSADGIYWSATDTLNSKTGIFPEHGSTSDCVWCFFQSSTPLGWSAYTSDNDKILRVVDPGGQTGGTSGGSVPFATLFTNSNKTAAVTGLTSLVTQGYGLQAGDIPTHTHSFTSNAVTANPSTNPAREYNAGNMTRAGGFARNTAGQQTGSIGFSSPHSHPITVPSSFSFPFNISVQYIDVKFCTFNG
jgi:hypothetical protein